MHVPKNSPERPLTRVVEAGGAKRGKVRPGHEMQLITAESSVGVVTLLAWMRRPTDRPTISMYCIAIEKL